MIVGVPVAARETCEMFRDLVDETVCAETPEPFLAVGYWYEHFDQTSDEEARGLLDRARAGKAHRQSGPDEEQEAAAANPLR